MLGSVPGRAQSIWAGAWGKLHHPPGRSAQVSLIRNQRTEKRACHSQEYLGGWSFPFLISSIYQMKHVQNYWQSQYSKLKLLHLDCGEEDVPLHSIVLKVLFDIPE